MVRFSRVAPPRSGWSLRWSSDTGGRARSKPKTPSPAFARARADGADGVELDVMTCGTGEVVVFHDDDLARLGQRPERIADTSFAALRAVTLASGARHTDARRGVRGVRPGHAGQRRAQGSEAVASPRSRRWSTASRTIVDAHGRRAPRVLVSSFHPLAVAVVDAAGAGRPARACCSSAKSPLPLRRAWAAALLRPFALHPERRLVQRRSAWRAGSDAATWSTSGPSTTRRRSRLAAACASTGSSPTILPVPGAGCARRAGCMMAPVEGSPIREVPRVFIRSFIGSVVHLG